MTSGGNGIDGSGRRSRLALAFALAGRCWLSAFPAAVSAQMFTDRPPPVPPASVPEAAGRRDEPGAAVRSGIDPEPAGAVDPAADLPRLPPVIVPPPGASTAGQAVLSLTARYGKDMPVITGGLVWRVFPDRPDETGTFKMIREDHGATPNIVLPPGSYVVHVALGLVSAVRPVTLKSETARESFVLPAGGLRIEGRVGTSQNSAEPDFVRDLQGQPVRNQRARPRWCRAFRPAMSRCCRRGPTTSSPTMATPIRWCARISACRPAS